MRARARRLVVVAAVAAAALAAPALAQAAPWCGTPALDDRPFVQAGYSIRVLYAHPSDGPDRSAELAPRIWADIEEIDAWWRTQDPTRTPHFDVTRFSCGLQLDLTSRRLGIDAATLAAADDRWDWIREDLFVTARVDGTYTKYLLYYDGPVDDAALCGEGAGGVSGTGLAVVYLGTCAGYSTAVVAAHELLHGLGALFRVTAPNACPGDALHVCDSPADLLSAHAQPHPLSAYILDAGRDDYYGHDRSWFDVRDSRWLRHLDARARIVLRVRGRGSVRSDVPGLACAASCTTSWNPETALILQATPAAGQRFVRWEGGDCATTIARCDLLLDESIALTAVFAPPRYRLAVQIAGRGRVAGRGVSCARNCARRLTSHVPVTLRATAARGWRLRGWTGACRGARLTCRVPLDRATTVRATFVRR